MTLKAINTVVGGGIYSQHFIVVQLTFPDFIKTLIVNQPVAAVLGLANNDAEPATCLFVN